ncbi:hypothetical protein [Elongatibacter sediminis]|uniref:Uncharacterized protein n=1 Tax=Elongatibacter sediminis TaxID=3119006 RepID=A0AAW9R768_9GAMM
MNDIRDPFRLASLPQPEPPGDAWPAVAAALRQRQRRRRLYRAAAGMVLAAGLTAWLQTDFPGLPNPGDPPRSAAADSAAATPAESTAQATASSASPERTLAALMSLSQQLEARLRRLRTDTGPMPSGALVYQIELEDLVAQVDDALSRQPDSPTLWSQRVNLLLDLNQLYWQSLRPETGQVASL